MAQVPAEEGRGGRILKPTLLLLFGVILLLAAPAAAQEGPPASAPTLVLTDGSGSYRAGESLSLLEDPTGALTLDDVLSLPYREQFVPQKTDLPVVGLTSSAYWGRLTARNESQEDVWILTLPDYFQDYLDFYAFDSAGRLLEATRTGRARAFASRDLPSTQFAFRAPLSPGEEVTIYIRNAGGYSMRFPVTLESLTAFARTNSLSALLAASTYGFLILMAVQNLLMFASLRDANYLLLALYILPTILTMSLRDGRAHQMLWPNHPELGRNVSAAAIGLQQIFLVAFSISFLRTRHYAPTLHALLVTQLIVLSLATALVVPLALGWIQMQPVIGLLTALGFPTVILLIIAGPLVWARGHPAARYFAIAQTVPLVFGITDLLYSLGVIAIPAGASAVPRIGTLLLVFFFSLSLADNAQVLRRVAEAAVVSQRDSERLSRQYLDAIPLGVAVYDDQKRLTYANIAAASLVQRERHEFGAEYSVSSRQFPTYRTSTGERYQDGEQPLFRGFQGQAGADDDLTMEVAGKPVPLQVWWKPLRDAGDRLTGVITVFSDISEKKRTEAELKRYQSELEVLIRERTQDLMEANSALVAKQRVADTLSEAATLLAAGPGLAPMLNRILELLGRVIAYKGAAILLEEDGEIKIVGAAGSSLTHLGQGISKMSGDPRARVYREGQRLVLEQGAAPDTAMEGGEETLGCRWIGLPLTADNRTFGVLALDSDESCAYEPSELTLLDAFAAQASAAVWIAQLYAQAQANAASAERERLARDLHDAVTQTLFSASIFTDMLPLQLEQEPEQVPRNLEKLGLLIRSALAEMRTLLMELRPTALIAVDLHQLIGNLINAARARTWAEFTYLVEGDSLGPLAPETQIATYRIAQELLNNVVKHSGATACEIVFTYLPEGIELTITDNGRGFDPRNVGLEHMGLAIMGERAKAIGGQLTVESKPRGGTRAMFCWRQRRESGRE